jgi:methylenetetrahydrofolate dehydrogenase (NADP+)/methenyltetrahydrofolate cyclohydrolase
MSARVLDGKLVATEIKQQIKEEVELLNAKGIFPGLGTILVGSDPGSVSYVKGKHKDCSEVGIASLQIELKENASFQDISAAVNELNDASECSGFIVQLPLPAQIDALAITRLIDPQKDADGLHPENLGLLLYQQPRVVPCTPLGIVKLLEHYKISLEGQHVVVVGRGLTVGRPLGLLLSQKEIDATVTLCHSKTADLSAHTSIADIVIAAAGIAGGIRAQDISTGAVCIDVGITRIGNALVGDFAEDVIEKASWISPMPGGTGPMTRAMLLANVVQLAQ